ncbi:uncharacterized protein BX663DRAFT_493046 [Cokeromyces recurvatus]|uniref:uncharacterized protein n=1 Tax=Cokeromyces recurvatus TaxID=90255 RepID=UPI00221F8982|nr:uncharacterized protein BX663DRAFT_493046 [Cokeromyces recurvatus]KAI7908120.1 hypothetical protein BX663DRAFT_493046 [Cokeromyces recurvatus]
MCFMDVKTGIYISVGLSFLHMLVNLTRPSVVVLGRIKLSITYINLKLDEPTIILTTQSISSLNDGYHEKSVK